MASSFKCQICGLQYSHRQGLQRHSKEYHGNNSSERKPPTPSLSCTVCSNSFDSKTTFKNHLLDVHDLPVTTLSKSFNSLDEFCEWKTEFEKETCAAFVKPRPALKCKASTSILYECNRSGAYHPKGKGLRHLKTQGSKKIGGYCPAEIKLKLLNSGLCLATCVTTHWGHDNDLEHLTLTPEERLSIATKIANNISFGDILDEVRRSVNDPDDLQRLHLLTNKDLHNIVQSFNLQSEIVEHHCDPLSTDNGEACFLAIQREKEEALSAIREVTSLIQNSTTLEEITAAKKLVLAILPPLSAVRASTSEVINSNIINISKKPRLSLNSDTIA